jgi:SAM-dependent methyltransferase
LSEFTGERVIPGEVDIDLWNEHTARYAFAARLAAEKRVLDAGCGTGYGSSALAQTARTVTGLDVAPEAVAFACQHYAAPNVRFLQASCSAMPFAGAGFDLVVAFEVIEHLAEWQEFLQEGLRVLAPGGLFVVSTPNRDYYAESRRFSGPNPFHAHEFDLEEFARELRAVFPHVHLYLQNHVESIAIRPAGSGGEHPELHQSKCSPDPAEAHFFLAVCSCSPEPAPPPFLYIPTTANVLRERELHIGKLQVDVDQLREEKEKLVGMFRKQQEALDEANRWARDLDTKLEAASTRITELQTELEDRTRWALDLDQQLAAARSRAAELQSELRQVVAGYEITAVEGENATGTAPNQEDTDEHERKLGERLVAAQARIFRLQDEHEKAVAKIAELEAENNAKTDWARRLEADLDAKGKDLIHCLEVLHETEKGLEERTAWALRVQDEIDHLRASRWMKLGKQLGLGPKLGAG